MKTQIMLSVILAIIVNGFVFAQSNNENAASEVIIERIIIDDNGQKTITKTNLIDKELELLGDQIQELIVEKDKNGKKNVQIVIKMKGDKDIETIDFKGPKATKECKEFAFMQGKRAPNFFKHKKENKAFLGVYTEMTNEGLAITKIVENSAAAAAGLQVGDIIVNISDFNMVNEKSLLEALSYSEVGETVKIKILRDGKSKRIKAALGKNPATLTQCERLEGKTCLGVRHSALRYNQAEGRKVRLTSVYEGSGAENAKLEKGDIVLSVDDQLLSRSNNITKNIQSKSPGDIIRLEVERAGAPVFIEAKLGEWSACDCVPAIKTEQSSATKPALTIPEMSYATLELANFQLYPVPAHGQVDLAFAAEAAPIIISLEDVSGRQIYRFTDKGFSGIFKETIDLTKAVPGLAVVRIIQNGQQYSEKLIIQ